MGIPSHTATAPTVHFTYPPSYLLKFPPSPEPQTVYPPVADYTFARPFSIDPETYNNALDVRIPVSIAIIYAITVSILNRVNRQRENKPWPISKSIPFYIFVVAHNVVLALYSGWTCLGMVRAIRHSWPGWGGENGLAGAIDTLCKIHGPRGLGSAATYKHESNAWSVTDKTVELRDGSPDSTDLGRIWNEGLAFYGWLFYLSKFYEIVDTFIILAKGKKSSLLQTYHHAGALMCLWAGIRYMSPPIWMFVLINSGLHAFMYLYYTLSALTVPIPEVWKRTLTTLQIVQFVFGASYAVAHLFIAYSIPLSIPYLFTHNLSSAIPAAASSVSSAVASATVTASLGNWLKKVALRAAGEEGLAENVRNRQGETFGLDAVHAAEVEKAQEEIRYKVEYRTVNCLDTSGEAFAIFLNALYLAPLTVLFVNFFIRKYIRGVKAASPPPDRKRIAKASAKEATHDVERKIREAIDSEQGGDDIEVPEEVKTKLRGKKASVKQSIEDLGSKAKADVKDAEDLASRAKTDVKKGAEEVRSKTKAKADLWKAAAEDAGSKAKADLWKGAEEVNSGARKTIKRPKDIAAGDKAPVKNDEAHNGAARGKVESETEANKKKPTAKPSEKEDDKDQATKPDSPNDPEKEFNSTNINDSPSEISTSTLLDGDEKAYEVNFDEVQDPEEKRAESAFGPNGLAADGEEIVGEDEATKEKAYEVNPDEVLDEAEKRAETEWQPNGEGS